MNIFLILAGMRWVEMISIFMKVSPGRWTVVDQTQKPIQLLNQMTRLGRSVDPRPALLPIRHHLGHFPRTTFISGAVSDVNNDNWDLLITRPQHYLLCNKTFFPGGELYIHHATRQEHIGGDIEDKEVKVWCWDAVHQMLVQAEWDNHKYSHSRQWITRSGENLSNVLIPVLLL